MDFSYLSDFIWGYSFLGFSLGGHRSILVSKDMFNQSCINIVFLFAYVWRWRIIMRCHSCMQMGHRIKDVFSS